MPSKVWLGSDKYSATASALNSAEYAFITIVTSLLLGPSWPSVQDVHTPGGMPDIADVVMSYHSSFDSDGNPVDPDGKGGLAAGFVPMSEIVEAGYDLNIGRYIRRAAVEQEDLGTLINAYSTARAERRKAEARMLAVLAGAGIEGFDE